MKDNFGVWKFESFESMWCVLLSEGNAFKASNFHPERIPKTVKGSKEYFFLLFVTKIRNKN